MHRLVRRGAEQGQVTAAFEPAADHPVLALLAEQWLEAEATLILRRVQAADGRSRAFINDQPVGVQLLRQVAGALVEIHGQHDDWALVDPAATAICSMPSAGCGAAAAARGLGARWQAAPRRRAPAMQARSPPSRANADYAQPCAG